MGLLKNVISNRKNWNIHNRELLSYSNIATFQYGSDIFVSKSRYGNFGFVNLPNILDLIIKDYYNVETTDKLTRFAMFNIPIKEELEEAIDKVLIKHGIRKR